MSALRSWSRAVAHALVLLAIGLSPTAAQTPSDDDRTIAAFLERLEEVLTAGDPAAFVRLTAEGPQRADVVRFAENHLAPGVTRTVMRERDRTSLAGVPPPGGVRLLMDVLIESGQRGSVRTWRLDLLRVTPSDPADPPWRIADAERLTGVDGLVRLSLSTTRQYRVENLRVTAEDLTLTFPSGRAFVAEAPEGDTAFVIIGTGSMVFAPAPERERGQVRVFADEDELRTRIEGAFIRLNPWDIRERFSKDGLVEEKNVSPRDLRRAQDVFADEIVKSFGLELQDLSRDHWSVVPPAGDFLAEVRTSRWGTLTYARSGGDAEDISVFDRKRRRNISVYSSKRKLDARGDRYYAEDEEIDYDVEHYDIDAHVDPRREWIEGRAELRLRVRAVALGTLTLRLSESLTVRSVVGAGMGRLLTLRVKDQNAVIVNLPRTVARGEEIALLVSYGGRLPTLSPDREVLLSGQQAIFEDFSIVLEPRLVYSQRSYWYPQSQVTDYATGIIRLTVPTDVSCVATGVPASGNPVLVPGLRSGESGHRYVFTVERPARYFATVVTRLERAFLDVLPPPAGGAPEDTTTEVTAVTPDQPAGSLTLDVVANPRQVRRGRDLAEQASDILHVYGEIVGEYPYSTFTITAVDDTLPGGHSPAYFALLNQPLPISPFSWRNDPVAFDSFPEFFLAHEIAHQYWGDAVGWENYHEQWISEGFAQYFAVLFAERTRSRDDLIDLRRKLRKTALDNERHGPIWLGYRLGHLQADGRIFRALVYNKSALVLHMLRRWLGDDGFFRGLRRLYQEGRFAKIGTGHVRRVFEAEAGQSLERFFQRWIHEAATPVIRATFRVLPPEGSASRNGGMARVEPVADLRTATPPAGLAVVRIEQRGPVFDLPVTLTLVYSSGQEEDVLVRLSDATTEVRLPLSAPLRTIELNKDEGALVEVVR